MSDTDPAPETSEVRGPWSEAVTFKRATLAAPTNITVVYNVAEKTISVSFDLVADATSYALSIKDAEGKEVLSGTSPTSPIDAPAGELAMDTEYDATLQALAAGIAGVWSAPIKFTPRLLTAPTISGVTNAATTIEVAFSLIEGANQYAVEILDAAGAPLIPPLTATGETSPIVVAATALVEDQSYQAKVRADVVSTQPVAQ